jgi:hypothetical protein
MYFGLVLIVRILKYARFKLFSAEMWNPKKRKQQKRIFKVRSPVTSSYSAPCVASNITSTGSIERSFFSLDLPEIMAYWSTL